MGQMRRRNFFVLIAALLLSASCFAALGGDVSSVEADQAHMRAQRKVTQTNAYSVHEMTAESGTIVREFVSPEGKVFGVSFSGPTFPDFKQLLGSYYDEYAQNAPHKRTFRPLSIETPNMVLQLSGHPRALSGRAYVPGMVPQGVRIEEIR